MVVFTCAHCGESVTKPKVEKHYLTRCRGRTPNLSCMDCFKDFIGTDHEAHTKCISEEQRYSAKGFVPKVNKGEEKQNAWVTMVQSLLSERKDAPKSVIRIVEEICKHSNTPRKKPRFINFVKNVCGHRTMPKDIEAAWDLISVKLSDLKSASQSNREQNGNKSKENGHAEKEDMDKSNADEPSNGSTTAADNIDESLEKNGIQETKTKKQRKEEKKRKKYEAELQSAAVVPTEEETEAKLSKKDKKKLKKLTENGEEPRLHKKRKITEDGEQTAENTDEQPPKTKRKKRKNTEENGVGMAEATEGDNDESGKGKLTEEMNGSEEAGNLHEQNVASDESKKDKTEKFDWHATILCLLQKKGNEMPFKRLQKKVLAEYAGATGKPADDRIVDKLCKKLRSAPNVKVDKNRVLLVE